MPLFQDAGGSGAALDTIEVINSAASVNASAWGSTIRVNFTATLRTLSLPSIAAGDVGKSITVQCTGLNSFFITQNGGTFTSVVGNSINPASTFIVKAVSVTESVLIGTNASQLVIANEGSVASTAVLPFTAASNTPATSILIPGLQFVATESARYQISANVRASLTNNNASACIALFDTTSPTVPIANTEVMISNNITAANNVVTGGLAINLNLISGRTYVVKCWNPLGTTTGSIPVGDANGRSTLSWTKLTGGVPVSGYTMEYISMSLNSVIAIANGATVPFDSLQNGNNTIPTSFGLFTLKAGKTYLLSAKMYTTTNGAFQWRTAAGVVLSAVQNTSLTGTIEAFYTPTVDTQVRLTNQTGAAVIPGGAGRCALTIMQVGATAITEGKTLVLKTNGNLSGDLGNVTFTVNAADPWTLTTSLPANGQTDATIVQYVANTPYDYWVSATPGVNGIIKRGRSWVNSTSGVIGLISAGFQSAASGLIEINAVMFKITAHSNGNFGICTIEKMN